MAESVAVSDLHPFPGNARRHDLDTITESLTENEQYQPIVVQASTMFVVAGNGTLEAARDRLGWTHIDADILDLSDEEALRINIVDNRARDLGAYDQRSLHALIAPLAAAGDLAGSGYDLDAFDDMTAGLGEPPADLDDPGGDNPHAETDAERDARANKGGDPPPDTNVPGVRPLLLMFTGPEHARYLNALSAASQGGESAAATVLRILRAAS